MGELGSGSGTSYPASLDTNNTAEVNSPNAGKTKARAEVPNDLGDAVVAIETELGTDPAGTQTDVKTFLQVEHNTDGTHSGKLSWSSLPDGASIQTVNTTDSAVATGTTTMPYDDTIPQNTEGDEYITLAITPKATTNKLEIKIVVNLTSNNAGTISAALFQDSTANALAAIAKQITAGSTGVSQPLVFAHYMNAGTTSSTTFKIRAGLSAANTTTFNGSASSRRFGGVIASSITITEIKAS